MAGLAVASFTLMVAGVTVAVALICGLARRGTARLGNFCVDLVRSCSTSFCRSRGSRRSCSSSSVLGTRLGTTSAPEVSPGIAETIAIGPVASQPAIKLLSGDGGGFFNVNSAHPFENPTGVSNVIEMLLMLLVPAAFTATFGRMISRRRQGWALYIAMLAMLIGGSAAIYAAESHGTPARHTAELDTKIVPGSSGGDMEGKAQRFGIGGSNFSCSPGPPAVTGLSTAASSPTQVL